MVSAQESWVVGQGVEEPGEERELLRAGLAGNAAALERLLALHKRSLYALCRGILGNSDDAEDAVQETFLRALSGLRRFRGDAPFRTWLLRIGVNLCLDWKASRGRTSSWDEEELVPRLATPSPEKAVLCQMGIDEALASLLPRHRTLILLKAREGWSVAEIARALRWSEKRVENELSRARRVLVEWRRRADAGEEG
jgi:RNA polymerase sigma-70 factor (ECF subfamily)